MDAKPTAVPAPTLRCDGLPFFQITTQLDEVAFDCRRTHPAYTAGSVGLSWRPPLKQLGVFFVDLNLSRYFSPQLAEEIAATRDATQPFHLQKAAILFADLRSDIRRAGTSQRRCASQTVMAGLELGSAISD